MHPLLCQALFVRKNEVWQLINGKKTIFFFSRGVSHCSLAIYIKKYLKEKEELAKLKYFTLQKYNLQKNPLKETKILQEIITLL